MELLKRLRVPLQLPNDFFGNSLALLRSISTQSSYVNQYTPEAPLLDNVDSRRLLYKLWWSYLDNTIYNSTEDGGFRELVNTYLGDNKVSGISPAFNPVERAVRAYEYVFDGKFGEDIVIDSIVKGEDVNQKIIEPIGHIWHWSNINEWKTELLIRLAALGTVGLRISYITHEHSEHFKRVIITQEHPSIIRDVDLDETGNLNQIVLEYDRMEGNFYDEDEPRKNHRYIEYMSKDVFWMVRDGEWWNFQTQENVENKEAATIKNPLGFVPYVLAKQTSIGSPFGVPCFYGRERQIDSINALAAHIVTQIRRHVTATWLVEGGGPKPKKIPFGDEMIWYVQREPGMGSVASATPLVAPLNIASAIAQQNKLLNELSNSMPELKATDGEFLSHQSGDTVSQLRLPAEQRILGARDNIESALIEAQKIALAVGVFYSVWDIGAGMGTWETADRSYHELVEHRFNKRRALPLSVSDELMLAKAEQAKAAASVTPDNSEKIPAPQGGDNVPISSSTTG